MMGEQRLWVPFFGLLRREIWRFLKVAGQTILTPMINSSLYLLIFGVSLGAKISMSEGLPYLGFLIPGLVMMAALNNAFQNSSSSISIAKFTGELEDLRSAPLTSSQIVWALSFGGLFRGLLVGSITFAVGTIFYQIYHDQWMAVENPLALVFFIVCGGLAFAKLGVATAIWAKTFDQMAAVNSFVLLPLIYLGGVFFSLDALHPTWQAISKVNPLLYLINGVRYGILGTSDVEVWLSATVALGSLALFHILAIRVISKGEFGRW